jgi:hypothetical protein
MKHFNLIEVTGAVFEKISILVLQFPPEGPLILSRNAWIQEASTQGGYE